MLSRLFFISLPITYLFPNSILFSLSLFLRHILAFWSVTPAAGYASEGLLVVVIFFLDIYLTSVNMSIVHIDSCDPLIFFLSFISFFRIRMSFSGLEATFATVCKVLYIFFFYCNYCLSNFFHFVYLPILWISIHTYCWSVNWLWEVILFLQFCFRKDLKTPGDVLVLFIHWKLAKGWTIYF